MYAVYRVPNFRLASIGFLLTCFELYFRASSVFEYRKEPEGIYSFHSQIHWSSHIELNQNGRIPNLQ